jgi:RNA polymerase sigma-70 factor (ECF subfamily)
MRRTLPILLHDTPPSAAGRNFRSSPVFKGSSPMADLDAPLMQAFQAGDLSAFDTLVDRHRARVVRLAYRYLGDENSAEDLAQETFLRVYRSKHTWKPAARFSTWLHRVTVNACLNELRARRARRGVETTASLGPDGTLPQESSDPKAPAPGDALLRAELAEKVRAAIAKLPDDQRVAVLLSKYEDLSYRELADALDRSVPAVKSLLVRARENLRQSLEAYLGFVSPAEAGLDDAGDAIERRKQERRRRREAGTGEKAS